MPILLAILHFPSFLTTQLLLASFLFLTLTFLDDTIMPTFHSSPPCLALSLLPPATWLRSADHLLARRLLLADCSWDELEAGRAHDVDEFVDGSFELFGGGVEEGGGLVGAGQRRSLSRVAVKLREKGGRGGERLRLLRRLNVR
jgi:hypothetical protein